MVPEISYSNRHRARGTWNSDRMMIRKENPKKIAIKPPPVSLRPPNELARG
jgi:hypothetical protein